MVVRHGCRTNPNVVTRCRRLEMHDNFAIKTRCDGKSGLEVKFYLGICKVDIGSASFWVLGYLRGI